MHTRSFCRRSDKNDKTTNFIAIYYTKRRKRFVRFGWERNRFRYNKIYINRRRRPQPAADNAMYICCVGHCFFSLRFSWIGRHRKYAWMANGMQIIVIRRLDFFFLQFHKFSGMFGNWHSTVRWQWWLLMHFHQTGNTVWCSVELGQVFSASPFNLRLFLFSFQFELVN